MQSNCNIAPNSRTVRLHRIVVQFSNAVANVANLPFFCCSKPSNKGLVQTFSSAAYLVITRYIACFPHIIVLFALLAFVHNAAFIQSIFSRSQSNINDSVHQHCKVFQCSDKCGNSALFLQQPPK